MIVLQLRKELNFARGKMMLDIDISIEEGSFVAISGQSGSGKTTLLRLIAGLTYAVEGKIIIKEKVWLDTSKKINLPPQKRRAGLVFQNYALFPNMTVQQNIKYALEKNQPAEIVDELIEIMELQELTKKHPNTLSSGQQQRVALARALVRKPPILLLDEPLSALDNEMRSRLQDYILKLHDNYNLTTILVSHDLGEIFKMANQVLVLEEGRITKTGTPGEVFLTHPTKEKYQFAGVVLQIIPNQLDFIINVKIGNNVVKVAASKAEISALKIGDKVILTAKGFSLVLFKNEG